MRSGAKERLETIDLQLSPKLRDLYLVVSDEGDKSHDWADWIEPRLVMKDGRVQDLTTLAWKTGSTGHGKIGVGKNCQGDPLAIGGKTYAKGFGVHADSVLYFKIPKGTDRFQAKVGLDDGGAIRGGQTTPAPSFVSVPPIQSS